MKSWRTERVAFWTYKTSIRKCNVMVKIYSTLHPWGALQLATKGWLLYFASTDNWSAESNFRLLISSQNINFE